MEEYLVVKDVARLLRLSPRTVARWISLGRIHPARFGRTLRFNKARLLRDLEKHEYPQDAPGSGDSATW